jgi:hypothetical protein
MKVIITRNVTRRNLAVANYKRFRWTKCLSLQGRMTIEAAKFTQTSVATRLGDATQPWWRPSSLSSPWERPNTRTAQNLRVEKNYVDCSNTYAIIGFFTRTLFFGVGNFATIRSLWIPNEQNFFDRSLSNDIYVSNRLSTLGSTTVTNIADNYWPFVKCRMTVNKAY